MFVCQIYLKNDIHKEDWVKYNCYIYDDQIPINNIITLIEDHNLYILNKFKDVYFADNNYNILEQQAHGTYLTKLMKNKLKDYFVFDPECLDLTDLKNMFENVDLTNTIDEYVLQKIEIISPTKKRIKCYVERNNKIVADELIIEQTVLL